MKKLLGVLVVAAAVSPAAASAPAFADEGPEIVTLGLINGWADYPGTRPAAASVVAGIVHLHGAIYTSGTNAHPFHVPSTFRPASTVYVKVDLCGGDNGRLQIESTGVVTVEAATFSDAQCFTSLDGATYAVGTLATPLAPINGWASYTGGTNAPAAANQKGVVHLQGAIATSGTDAVAFILPPKLRPADVVYVPVDMCGATNGRLEIDTAGNVTVEAETSFSDAQCFTSLEGAWYSIEPLTSLTLLNGWTDSPYGTAAPGAENIGGVVTFGGAMSTSGTDMTAFTLPPKLRPSADVYVPVDLCGAVGGRFYISSASGQVTVQVESTGTIASPQCFTSLDGVSFSL